MHESMVLYLTPVPTTNNHEALLHLIVFCHTLKRTQSKSYAQKDAHLNDGSHFKIKKHIGKYSSIIKKPP